MSEKKGIKENADKLSKKKSTKTQIDQEDNKVVRFQRFVENNRKLVMSVSFGIVAVTVLFFIIRSWADKKSEENVDIKFRYIYFSGLCSEKVGDKKTAEGKFRQIVLESTYSEFSNYAKIGLTRLGTIIE